MQNKSNVSFPSILFGNSSSIYSYIQLSDIASLFDASAGDEVTFRYNDYYDINDSQDHWLNNRTDNFACLFTLNGGGFSVYASATQPTIPGDVIPDLKQVFNVYPDGVVIDGNSYVYGNETVRGNYTPTATLDVNGTGKFSSNVSINGTLALPTSGITAPSSNTTLVPINIGVVGNNASFMGSPVTYATISVNGTNYKVPCY